MTACDHMWSDPALSAPSCHCVKCGTPKARAAFPLPGSLQGFAQWADDIAHGRLRNVDPAPKFWLALASDLREAAAILAAAEDAPARIRSYIGNLTGDADDPFYQAVLALWGAGFDYAHGLRACGHSIGDWRDPDYDPAKPDQPLECRCVGCAREARLLGALNELTAACEEDCAGPSCDFFDDAESVASGEGGDSALTFGMIRRARAALSSDPQPLGSAREATEDGQHKTNPEPGEPS